MQEGGNARPRNVPRENKKEGKRPSILLRAAQNERVPKRRQRGRERKRVLQRMERSIMEHIGRKKTYRQRRMKGGWMQSRKVMEEEIDGKNRKREKSE